MKQKFSDNLPKTMQHLIKHTHIVDCEIVPHVPEYGLRVVQQKIGKVEWRPENIGLYLSEEQMANRIIRGTDLKDKVQLQKVLSANVLDFLLENSALIPPHWLTLNVYFWGTIYEDENGDKAVRCLDLQRKDGRKWSCPWLGKGWNASTPAAVLID